jgi:UDP-N-acetylglucosamine 2-epimerase (non-hydrolysing)/GDP/UDP-N,N'-diacetylbacillosamine 2-epimerase (hydrolysing)
MRTIAVITGTRAEYGLLKPVMQAIQAKGMTLQLVVTGMHLSRKHGYTVREIENDGFIINEWVRMYQGDDGGGAMAKGLGAGITGITRAFEKLNPDIVLVLGDRSEALAGAIAGAYLNKIVAHIHGGEVSKGCIDESIRHAITKFSHIHFPATEESAERIRRLGERPENIHVVGAPGLDAILSAGYTPPEQVAEKYMIGQDKPLVLAVQHPVTQQAQEAAEQMRTTLEALRELGAQTILIYPNNDAGGQSMMRVIEGESLPPNIKVYRSIRHEDYLGIMRLASVIVGNSSSGIIEAPSFKLPAVNIGIRQEGRLRGSNVIEAPHGKEAIIKAMLKALNDGGFRRAVERAKNPYGDGKTSGRIANILYNVEITDRLRQKQITY